MVSHQAWNELLTKYVSDKGVANYKAMMNEKGKLQSYLQMLGENPPQTAWPESEQMAYWINAYNAFTVKLILDHYPVKSIRDIDGGKPWDDPFITIGGEKYSLNNIEHDILRTQFNDPRIHFAINCASKSCPRLLNEAYTAVQLDQQLNAQAKEFVNDPSKNKITTNSVQLSSIFDWYKDDFTKKGTLIDFLNQYSSIKIQSTATISFLNYDWSLNE
ncbi:MAG: DUF547 domain-containing protein [Chitinophagales bacterium]